jgi:two-component system cell cycle response regulator
MHPKKRRRSSSLKDKTRLSWYNFEWRIEPDMDDVTKTRPVNLSRRRLDQAERNVACLVVIGGPSIGERFPIAKNRTVIGRQRGADVWIDDKSVSRSHAEIVLDGEETVLCDLGSKNGTFCNNHKTLRRILVDGDLIQIGDATFKYVGRNSIEQVYLKELSERAIRDSLTGIFNKQTFFTYLDRNLVRCRDLNEPLSMAMLDLDWFKKINDGWGHLAGDYVLKEFADRVKIGIRPTDLLARYGGEEFGLIFPHTNLNEATIVAERIRNQINSRPFVFEGQTLPVTVSIGVAERDESIEAPDALIACADQALYRAKREGRNRTCRYSKDA